MSVTKGEFDIQEFQPFKCAKTNESRHPDVYSWPLDGPKSVNFACFFVVCNDILAETTSPIRSNETVVIFDWSSKVPQIFSYDYRIRPYQPRWINAKKQWIFRRSLPMATCLADTKANDLDPCFLEFVDIFHSFQDFKNGNPPLRSIQYPMQIKYDFPAFLATFGENDQHLLAISNSMQMIRGTSHPWACFDYIDSKKEFEALPKDDINGYARPVEKSDIKHYSIGITCNPKSDASPFLIWNDGIFSFTESLISKLSFRNPIRQIDNKGNVDGCLWINLLTHESFSFSSSQKEWSLQENMVIVSEQDPYWENSHHLPKGSIWINLVTKEVSALIDVNLKTKKQEWKHQFMPAFITSELSNEDEKKCSIGSLLINPELQTVQECVSVNRDATLHFELQNIKTNVSETDPSTEDNLLKGFTASSTWINTETNTVLVCLQSSLRTATWEDKKTFVVRNTNPSRSDRDEFDNMAYWFNSSNEVMWQLISNRWDDISSECIFSTKSPTTNQVNDDNENDKTLWVNTVKKHVFKRANSADSWSPHFRYLYKMKRNPTSRDAALEGLTKGSIVLNTENGCMFEREEMITWTENGVVKQRYESFRWKPLTVRSNVNAITDPDDVDISDPSFPYTNGSVWYNTESKKMHVFFKGKWYLYEFDYDTLKRETSKMTTKSNRWKQRGQFGYEKSRTHAGTRVSRWSSVVLPLVENKMKEPHVFFLRNMKLEHFQIKKHGSTITKLYGSDNQEIAFNEYTDLFLQEENNVVVHEVLALPNDFTKDAMVFVRRRQMGEEVIGTIHFIDRETGNFIKTKNIKRSHFGNVNNFQPFSFLKYMPQAKKFIALFQNRLCFATIAL